MPGPLAPLGPHFRGPRPPCGARAESATHVLLHLREILLGEGRRGGLHGGGGRWRLFRMPELGLRRPALNGGF